MEENNKIHLTFGIFFSLFTVIKNPLNKRNNPLQEFELLDGLMNVIEPGHFRPEGTTLKNNTSLIKSCSANSTGWINIEDELLINQFKNSYQTDRDDLLKRVDSFIREFITIKEKEYYIKTFITNILYLIKNDTFIKENEEFYILNLGQPIKKKGITSSIDRIVLQDFILGILYFLITSQPENKSGAYTYDCFFPQEAANGPRKYTQFFKTTLFDNIKVVMLDENDARLTTRNDYHGTIEAIGSFYTYCKKIIDECGNIKTLLYTSPVYFYDFYVPNDIYIRNDKGFVFGDVKKQHIIEKPDAYSIFKRIGNRVIIEGTGGIGKSMMMRHLLLDTAKKYKGNNIIPILILLKDFDLLENDTLEDYIYEKNAHLLGCSKEVFNNLLKTGNVLFLFDGMDEINKLYEDSFEKKLLKLTSKYSSNMFVISSRPYREFVSFQNFCQVLIQPFDREQSLSLIDKLEFRPDMPEIKKHFKEELESKLFISHRDFTSNPLLLTIMLMTFEEYAEIPSKMHLFYQEAFETLAKKHDASKGAYKRSFKTGLSTEEISDVFTEFCGTTYLKEKYQFTTEEFENFVKSSKSFQKYKFTINDLIYDVCQCLCLVFYEDGLYHFTHRSFQEYFCAKFLARQKDSNLTKIGKILERDSRRQLSDKVFEMIYEMIPSRFTEFIVLPFLEDLFKRCDSEQEKADSDDEYLLELKEHAGYIHYLKNIYPVIYYSTGDVECHSTTPTSSVTYKLARRLANINSEIMLWDFPEEESYLQESYCEIEEKEKDGSIYVELKPKSEVKDYDESGNIIYPDEVGWDYEFVVKEVIDESFDCECTSKVVDALINYDCDFYEEYEKMRKFLIELKDKYANKISDDILDVLD